ncbi:MAG: rhomboid family intramembrane serine protease [Acidobacteria bacterium]|nr:rhomboid family intramembrane serine protease [Acidobacteriota bacterium]
MSSGYRGGWGGPSYRTYGGGFGYALTPAVKKLLILNGAAFFALALLRIFSPADAVTAVRLLGLVPRDVVFSFFFWQPLTYLFLHSGFLHIFFNMFALWMFGTPLERDWGSRRFLRYYFLTGIGAGLLNVVVGLLWGGAAAIVPTIGASGAIYGLLLAFGLLYPRAPIFLWFLFPVPARVFVLIFGALAFLSALEGPGARVNHVAHLGGMLVGFFFLRGNSLYHRGLNRYADWRMRHLRRKFEVYMRQQDEQERRTGHPDQWVN